MLKALKSWKLSTILNSATLCLAALFVTALSVDDSDTIARVAATITAVIYLAFAVAYTVFVGILLFAVITDKDSDEIPERARS